MGSTAASSTTKSVSSSTTRDREPSVLAVDPGRNGGVALLRSDGGIFCWSIPNTKGVGIDEERIWCLFQDKIKPLVTPDTLSFIELVHSRPLHARNESSSQGRRQRQGTKQAFTFGGVTYYLKACLRSLEQYPSEISPREWIRGLGLPKGGDKSVNMALAVELFGDKVRVTKKGSDALLIAEYARRHLA